MNHLEVKSVLETLARGVDPATGEMCSEQSPFNNPQVIRALFIAVGEIDKLIRREPVAQAEHERPQNAGRAWPSEEDRLLLERFDAGMSPKQLAAKHGRTEGAINARLARHGRVEN